MASASRQNMHAGVASLSLAAQVHRMPPELQSTIFTYTHHPSITYEPEPLVKGGYLSSVQHAYIYSPNTALGAVPVESSSVKNGYAALNRVI